MTPLRRFWGYPRVGYLDPALISSRPELAGSRTAPVPARDKHRLEWPTDFESRPAVPPYARQALLILTRRASAGPAGECGGCAGAVAAATSLPESRDSEVLARVEDDLREQLSGMAVLEFGLSPDLNANHARLVSVLER